MTRAPLALRLGIDLLVLGCGALIGASAYRTCESNGASAQMTDTRDTLAVLEREASEILGWCSERMLPKATLDDVADLRRRLSAPSAATFPVSLSAGSNCCTLGDVTPTPACPPCALQRVDGGTP